MESVTKVKLNPKENPLKQIRQELGMTQIEFAEAIKATQRSIVRWENGQTKPALTIPQIKALQRQMKRLGLDFSDIPDDFN
jgi:DNA-binding XRE family transcriptional regulator